MMKKTISDAVSNISTRHIEEAAEYTVTKKPHKHAWVKLGAMAACLAIIAAALAVFVLPDQLNHQSNTTPNTANTDTGDNFMEVNPNGTELEPSIQPSNDTGPVYYSSLMLADSEINQDALSLSDTSMIDVIAFDEALLSQDSCIMIIEGTVVDLYVKHYEYDVYNDKFDENDTMHSWADTVIYEIAVDKTWFGEDVSGGTILVEDTTYFGHPTLAIKEGQRYVLPLCEYGDTIWTLGHEYAGGNITRESKYCTIYPEHPQIEVTDDGFYLISDDWETLVRKNAKEVIMDTLEDGDFWKEKMYLVDGNTFAEQMSALIGGIKTHAGDEEQETYEKQDDYAEAEETARAYYANTVFEVISMELKEQTAEEISFSVCVSKGGVVQEPNRTIFLRLVNSVWEVVNEGY